MATGDLQLHHDNTPAHVSRLVRTFCRVFGETSNHPGDSAPLQARSGTLRLLAFPKTKITFERREVSDHWWGSGKYDGAADGDWENCVRSQGTYFEGHWGIIVLCTAFLVLCIFFSNVSTFLITWLDTFWIDLYICKWMSEAILQWNFIYKEWQQAESDCQALPSIKPTKAGFC